MLETIGVELPGWLVALCARIPGAEVELSMEQFTSVARELGYRGTRLRHLCRAKAFGVNHVSGSVLFYTRGL